MRITALRSRPRRTRSHHRKLAGGAVLAVVAMGTTLVAGGGAAFALGSTASTTNVTGASPAAAGSTVTYTATVVYATGPVATGTVEFFDGGTPISGCGVQPLVGATTTGATATCADLLTVAATHTITAAYSGDSNYALSTVGTSAATVVTPGAATIFVASAGTTPITAGGTDVITITAKDAFANTATAYAGTVHLTSNDAAATLPADATLTAGTGTRTVTLNTAGTTQHVTATDTVTGSITGTTGNVVVNVGVVNRLLVTTPTLVGTVGTPITVTVKAVDAGVDVITGYADTAAITTTAGATIAGSPVTFTSGVGTATITPTATGSQTVTATGVTTGSIHGTSAAIVVGAASSGGGGTVATTPVAPVNLAGTDRFGTAVAVSTKEFPTTGSAGAVVLARSDDYPDALAGNTLAAAKNAPLLFADGGVLTAATQAEIQRVLPAGGTVYVLGGTAAVPSTVDTTLTGLGFTVTRVAGTDRYGTALAVAAVLGNPTTVMLATGINFPDALSAGPAAAHVNGVVLLTDGTTMPTSVTAYLAAHPGTVYAVGGPAVAADPSATPLTGVDRYATSAAVASLFTAPTTVGVASGTAFPDALAGGAFQAHAGGPLLLTDPGTLPAATSTYLTGVKASVASSATFGGTDAISTSVDTAIGTALGVTS